MAYTLYYVPQCKAHTRRRLVHPAVDRAWKFRGVNRVLLPIARDVNRTAN